MRNVELENFRNFVAGWTKPFKMDSYRSCAWGEYLRHSQGEQAVLNFWASSGNIRSIGYQLHIEPDQVVYITLGSSYNYRYEIWPSEVLEHIDQVIAQQNRQHQLRMENKGLSSHALVT